MSDHATAGGPVYPLPVNGQRGECAATLDGRQWTLCLTLGALASLEAHFEVANLPELLSRLGSGNLSSADMLAIIHAGLGGGGANLTREEVSEMRVEGGAAGYAVIVANLLGATFPAVAEPGS